MKQILMPIEEYHEEIADAERRGADRNEQVANTAFLRALELIDRPSLLEASARDPFLGFSPAIHDRLWAIFKRVHGFL